MPPDCITDLQWEHQSNKKFQFEAGNSGRWNNSVRKGVPNINYAVWEEMTVTDRGSVVGLI